MRDAVLNRISTRTFKKQNLEKSDIESIVNLLQKYQMIPGPFGNHFEMTFNLNNSKKSNGKKIGTYGMLKNVPAFIGGICDNEFKSIIDFGYVFEHVILELTELEYGTCWLGGTFKRKDYRKKLGENEIIPAISPVGFKADKRSLIDRAVRRAAQSKNRKSLGELFRDYKTQEPLKMSLENPIIHSLSLVRRAPSASNKQPWRAFVNDNKVHFYLKRTVGYASALKYDIQAIDIGIALAHFDAGMKHFKQKFNFKTINNPKKIEDLEYVISAEISK